METWIKIIISCLTLFAGSGWLKYYFELKNNKKSESKRLLNDYLIQVKIRLESNLAIKNRIYSKYREGNWGILESYVVKVKNGIKKRDIILMAKDIATMEHNNCEIIKLLHEYSGHALLPEFDEAASKYINHAHNWVNRASVLSEVVETGEQLPYAEPYPEYFSNTLQKEIEKRKNN